MLYGAAYAKAMAEAKVLAEWKGGLLLREIPRERGGDRRSDQRPQAAEFESSPQTVDKLSTIPGGEQLAVPRTPVTACDVSPPHGRP